MDNTIIAIIASASAVIATVIASLILILRQGGKQDAANAATNARIDNLAAQNNARFDNLSAEIRAELSAEIRATNARIDNLSAEIRAEIRAYAYAIENRINLDERVRDVEQRTAPAPQAQRRDAEIRRDSQS